MPPPAAPMIPGFLELRAAIALQRAEHVAGQAFAVQAHQRRLPAERADDQRDMLLPVVRRGRRRSGSAAALERQLGAGDDLDRGARRSRRCPGRNVGAPRAASTSHSAGSSPAGAQAQARAAAAWGHRAASDAAGPIGAAVEIAAGIGERQRRLRRRARPRARSAPAHRDRRRRARSRG